MPGPTISDESVGAACRAHLSALAEPDPETDGWGNLEPEAREIFREAMRAAIRAFVETHGFV